MDYKDIIKDNRLHHSATPWWTDYAFHFTDVTNAVDILRSERLYSRTSAEKLGVMHNDNASRQVIDMTKTEAVACVRFYFRPQTPTQYYNEGFKHVRLRYDEDINANIPVPIFLLFDLEELLKMPAVKFSEQSQSGYGAALHNGIEEFKTLDFDKIYSTGYVENFKEINKYRQAEVLYPNVFDITTCIRAILCRNEIERLTLLNLLRVNSNKTYLKYNPIIKVCRREVFYNNGLFITNCLYHAGTIHISFSQARDKNHYANKMMQIHHIEDLSPIKVKLKLSWLKSAAVLYHSVLEKDIDYHRTSSIDITGLPPIPGAKTLDIKVFFEDKLMCFIHQSLEEIELIK